MKNSKPTPKALAPPIKDGTPFQVSATPLIGEEVGDEMEDEENSNSPSFADVLNKDSRHSPPLIRGRKSNKECREKEAESRILSGSQQILANFLLN